MVSRRSRVRRVWEFFAARRGGGVPFFGGVGAGNEVLVFRGGRRKRRPPVGSAETDLTKIGVPEIGEVHLKSCGSQDGATKSETRADRQALPALSLITTGHGGRDVFTL